MGNEARPYVGKDSLLYQIYKDKIDEKTGVPDCFMSIRRASVFAGMGEAQVRRQVAAGLLPVRKRGTRLDVNPADVVRLNTDGQGRRLLVNCRTGERRPYRRNAAAQVPLREQASKALRRYPEWLQAADEFAAYAERHGGPTRPRWNKAASSMASMPGDRTGHAAQILADMPASLRQKTIWARSIYAVVFRRRLVVNERLGLTAESFLRIYLWGSQPVSLEEAALALGISPASAKRYYLRIRDEVAMEAARRGLG